jgi:hypothetical protein
MATLAVLTTLLTGIFDGRSGKRRTMIASDLIRAGLTGVMPQLLGMDALRPITRFLAPSPCGYLMRNCSSFRLVLDVRGYTARNRSSKSLQRDDRSSR